MSTTTQLEPPRAFESHELASVPKPMDESITQLNDAPAEEQNQSLDKATILKLLAAGLSFFVSGINDGSMGPLIPYIIREYDLSTAVVSIIYVANFLGWFIAAVSNTHLIQFFDLSGLLSLGAALQIVAHALRAWKPPFSFFAVTFGLVCLGQAYQDTGCNTFVTGVKGAHRWLAFIHAMYAAGTFVAPFVATPIASAGEPSRWYLFYVCLIGLCVVNFALTTYAFRDTISPRRFRRRGAVNENTAEDAVIDASNDQRPKKTAFQLVRASLSTPSVWLVSLFFFFYLGAVITASGWVVEYLVKVRGGDLAKMGYVPAGFNGGTMLGRLLLAEPTYRLGERRMVMVYVVLCLAFQLVFWLVPNIIAASAAISVVGFFAGPLFATGVSIGSKLFDPEIKGTALSFIFVFGQIGGSLFPIITGVVASNKGVGVLQPVLVSLLAGTGISWMFIPRPKQTANPALHQE